MRFPGYVAVDWSAAAVPRRGPDSIWIAARDRSGLRLDNPATRAEAIACLRAILDRAPGPLLCGFDFPFGCPAGTALALTGQAGWRGLWARIAAEVSDGPDNANDRFDAAARLNAAWEGAGPFWGNGLKREIPGLPRRRPSGWGEALPPLKRHAETMVPRAQEVWKLSGAGSVGGQALTGIAALERLRHATGAEIWPFETAAGRATEDHVFAEIYPSLLPPDPAETVRDAGQVRAVVAALAALDASGDLSAHLDAPYRMPSAVTREEAAILGMSDPEGFRASLRRPALPRRRTPRHDAAHPERRQGGSGMDPWLDVIGIGEDGWDGLSGAARARLAAAQVIVAGRRHAGLAETLPGRAMLWPQPFSAMVGEIRALRGTPTAILVTGDPLWYSAGARFAGMFPPGEVVFHPQISAFQLAAARMGWSLADLETLTVHGRPAEQAIPFFAHGQRLLILTQDAGSPAAVARLLVAEGLGDSRLAVLGALGGPEESRIDGLAAGWDAEAPDFHILAVECIAAEGARPPPRTGLPGTAFTGAVPGREIRAMILSALEPRRGRTLWATGAGAAAIAIEWLRAARDMEAVLVEPDPGRRAEAGADALRLGAPRLRLAENIGDLPTPDAVYLGEGAAETAEAMFAPLGPPGRAVASATTDRGAAALSALHRARGGRLLRLSVREAGEDRDRRIVHWAWPG